MGAYAFVERQKMGLSLEADGMPKLYKVRCRNIDLCPQNALFRLNGAHGSSANAACLDPAEDGRMYMFPNPDEGGSARERDLLGLPLQGPGLHVHVQGEEDVLHAERNGACTSPAASALGTSEIYFI